MRELHCQLCEGAFRHDWKYVQVIFKGKEDRQGGKKDVSVPNKKMIKRAFFITYQ